MTFQRPKTVEKILDAIESNPKITQNELMEVTSLTRRGVEWNLAKLKEKGIVKRIGPAKGGYWEIIKSELHQISNYFFTGGFAHKSLFKEIKILRKKLREVTTFQREEWEEEGITITVD